MSPAVELVLPRLVDARHPFAHEDVFRRIRQFAELKRGARVLELGLGQASAAAYFAKESGCQIVSVIAERAWGRNRLAPR